MIPILIGLKSKAVLTLLQQRGPNNFKVFWVTEHKCCQMIRAEYKMEAHHYLFTRW